MTGTATTTDAPLPPLTLVLGGARSGKSRYAERLVLASGLEPVYLATARALDDDEMARRIAEHRSRRGAAWRTVEEPLDLPGALARHAAAPGRAVLVECLTLWLTNLMVAGRDVSEETGRLLRGLDGLPAPVVLVSNEVGQGVVPANAMARAFVDSAGRLHRDLAALADAVTLLVAGLPLHLKTPPGPPSP